MTQSQFENFHVLPSKENTKSNTILSCPLIKWREEEKRIVDEERELAERNARAREYSALVKARHKAKGYRVEDIGVAVTTIIGYIAVIVCYLLTF